MSTQTGLKNMKIACDFLHFDISEIRVVLSTRISERRIIEY